MRDFLVLTGALLAMAAGHGPTATCANRAFEDPDAYRTTVEQLRRSNVIPLCEAYPAPEGADFYVRLTTTHYQQHRRFSDLRAVGDQIVVITTDTMLTDPTGTDAVATITPGDLRRRLAAAGLDGVWSASDAPCTVPEDDDPETLDNATVIAEIGEIVELYSKDGYWARGGPLPRVCDTPLDTVWRPVIDLLDETVRTSRVTRRWIPQLPPASPE